MKAWFNLFLFSGYFLCILMAVSCCSRGESKGAFVLPEYPAPVPAPRDTCSFPDFHISDWENVSFGSFILPEYPDPLDSCLSPALQECLRLYPHLANSWAWDYIIVEFFQQDTSDYFTISINDGYVKRCMKTMNPAIKYDYYWFQYYGADIIFVKKHDDKRVLPFKPCISLMPSEDIVYLPDKEIMTRKSFYPRTYRYYFDGKRYRIEGLRDTIYYGHPSPIPRGVEVKWMQQENKRLGLDPKKPYPQI